MRRSAHTGGPGPELGDGQVRRGAGGRAQGRGSGNSGPGDDPVTRAYVLFNELPFARVCWAVFTVGVTVGVRSYLTLVLLLCPLGLGVL